MKEQVMAASSHTTVTAGHQRPIRPLIVMLLLMIMATVTFAQTQEIAYGFEEVRCDETCKGKTRTVDLVVNGLVVIADSTVVMYIDNRYYQYEIDMTLLANDGSTKYFLKGSGGVLTIYTWWILHVQPLTFEDGCEGTNRSEFMIRKIWREGYD